MGFLAIQSGEKQTPDLPHIFPLKKYVAPVPRILGKNEASPPFSSLRLNWWPYLIGPATATPWIIKAQVMEVWQVIAALQPCPPHPT